MLTYYVTFPFKDEKKRNKYQKVTALTYALARNAVFQAHGNQFAIIYPEVEFEGQPERYSLTPLDWEIVA